MRLVKNVAKWFSLILLSLIILLIIFSTVRNRIGNSSIQANISGLGTTLALIDCERGPKVVFCINDHFKCKINTSSLSTVSVIFPETFMRLESGKLTGVLSKRLKFFIDKNEQIEVTGDLRTSGINYTIIGSSINEQYSDFKLTTREIYQTAMKKDIEYKNTRDTSTNLAAAEEKFKAYQDVMQEYHRLRYEYIVNNPDRALATYLLSISPRDSVQKYADLIKPEARINKYWERIEQKRADNKILIAGKPPPEIDAKDLQGKVIQLKKFRGKYVVLDVWGSWCKPCIEGIPDMKAYYEKYIDQVQFVGVACDDTESDLRKAIKKYDLPWIQILDRKDNDISKRFKIEAYPTKIILDSEGNIIEIFKGEKFEFYQNLDEIMM